MAFLMNVTKLLFKEACYIDCNSFRPSTSKLTGRRDDYVAGIWNLLPSMPAIRLSGILESGGSVFIGKWEFDKADASTIKANVADFITQLQEGAAPFKKEYARVRSYFPTGKKCEAWLANPKKNRHKDILLLDATRVVLTGGTSDYVHASKVIVGSKTFICCQAPLVSTVNDMWRTIDQQSVKAIIMLCRNKEDGVHKCAPYYPLSANETMNTDDYKVICKAVRNENNNIIVTTLQYARGNSKAETVSTNEFVRVEMSTAVSQLHLHHVVSDVLPEVNEDLQELKVHFGNGVEAYFGNELTPTQVQHRPHLSWKADENALYTVIMTDPDAPSHDNPVNKEFKHWLVIDVPGSKVEHGTTLAEYVGAGPPEGSGMHRYVFLVYKQSRLLESLEYVPVTSAGCRRKFNTAEWARKHHLIGPIAANMFQAQFDDYVPILHEAFKD